MKKFLCTAVLTAALIFSCASRQSRFIPELPPNPPAYNTPRPYIITGHKNREDGGEIPDWVSYWLLGGAGRVESLDTYRDRYVFIGTGTGVNFTSISQWCEGFSAELDFPRLAASRIEARIFSSSNYPDLEYGDFYESLIRAASDYSWEGAKREDDFWISKRILPESGGSSDENPDEPELPPGENGEEEMYEFLILVTIEKSLFTSQLNMIFEYLRPNPQPTRDQISAANRLKERFYYGF